ncbi:hypothetical protein CPLU01_05913 [Colletotrichum plurivorum]|uniref:Uncharacterized protein n=1 Tax=Colletotrichum plurivorum TaxID=2175906 RepID=A0A8H6KJR0_9PEZI|nr:hypothetical protein CPLU01_05913 [Colletotrichum plurivorum]
MLDAQLRLPSSSDQGETTQAAGRLDAWVLRPSHFSPPAIHVTMILPNLRESLEQPVVSARLHVCTSAPVPQTSVAVVLATCRVDEPGPDGI